MLYESIYRISLKKAQLWGQKAVITIAQVDGEVDYLGTCGNFQG